MNIAAGFLGLLGGLVGIIQAYFALSADSVGVTVGVGGVGTAFGFGWGALLCALVGTVGGGLAFVQPRLAGYLMLVGGAGGAICISRAYMIAAPLLLLASALAFLVKKTYAHADLD